MNSEAINLLLEARVRDLASRRLPTSVAEHRERIPVDTVALRRSLGLDPLPARTDMAVKVTGTLEFDGYRIEKIRYESRPGLLVTAHLYLPSGPGPFPLILRPHGHVEGKKAGPAVQASAIGLSLAGFAVFVVDSPGYSWDVNPQNERKGLGTHDDPWLSMASPVFGVYAWDLIRGLDYLETRPDIDSKRVGITGSSGGGQATLYTFALDSRIVCAAPVCSMASLSTMPHNGCWCNHLSGLVNVGDRSDILGLRAPAPVMIVGATDDPEFPTEGNQLTYDRLRAIHRLYRSEESVRLEIVESPHDYNRRMREAVLAFFREHLMGDPRRSYLPELRPLTDGDVNPYPGNTLPWTAPEMQVTGEFERGTLTFRDVADRALREPYPEAFDAQKRLVPWRKYGRVEAVGQVEELHLNDEELKAGDVDARLAVYLGLSVPELLAQLLHYSVPGGPEGWEGATLGVKGDMVTSMIASMRTLVGDKSHEEGPTRVVAEGPIASMVAIHLGALRPQMEIRTSHEFHSWLEIWASGVDPMFQPGARYLEWPRRS